MRTPAMALRAGGALVLSAVILAEGGCIAPALDAGAYRHNAVASLDSAVSETRTAATAIETYRAQRTTQPFTDVLVTSSEESLGPITDSFAAVDPPRHEDLALRKRVTSLLSDASEALADARIAVRTEDRAGMRQSVADLSRIADQMEKASEGLT